MTGRQRRMYKCLPHSKRVPAVRNEHTRLRLAIPYILHSVLSQQASLRFVQWNQSYGTCIPKAREHGPQWPGLLFPTGREECSQRPGHVFPTPGNGIPDNWMRASLCCFLTSGTCKQMFSGRIPHTSHTESLFQECRLST